MMAKIKREGKQLFYLFLAKNLQDERLINIINVSLTFSQTNKLEVI